MTEKKKDTKKVWIRCRADEKCEGNEAELLSERKQIPVKANTGLVGGSFQVAERAGKTIRYRCLTCGKIFEVSQ